MSNPDKFFSKAMGSVAALTVRSALNPMLWLCGIVTLPILVISSFIPSIGLLFQILACIPVGVVCFGFFFLLFFDRDRLQSENYQIRKQSLELIEQKGDLQPIEATTIELIANPESLSQSSRESGESE